MRPTIFHLRDLGIGIIRMFPFLVGTLLRSLPIQFRQIFLRRRLDSAGSGQFRQKIRVTFARVPPNNRTHRRIRLQCRPVDADRFAVNQSVSGQHLQHPCEYSAVGFQIDQPPRPRNR